MNFQRGRPKEDPEINLIPMIDVLLVVLIFLMITTTYSKFSEMEIILPQANAEKSADRPNTISISISATGGIRSIGRPLSSQAPSPSAVSYAQLRVIRPTPSSSSMQMPVPPTSP